MRPAPSISTSSAWPTRSRCRPRICSVERGQPPSGEPGSAVCSGSSSATPTRSKWGWARYRPSTRCPLRLLGLEQRLVLPLRRATSSTVWRSGRNTAPPSRSPRAGLERDASPLMPDDGHVPVLLEEAIAALAVRPEGTYVDATLGAAATPRDPRPLRPPRASSRSTAIRRPRRAPAGSGDPRFVFVALVLGDRKRAPHHSEPPPSTEFFSTSVFPLRRSTTRRAILISHRRPLDMRMDPTRGESGSRVPADARDLTEVIRDYGEETVCSINCKSNCCGSHGRTRRRHAQLAAIVAKAVGARPAG